MPKMKISILPGGNIETDFEGFEGDSCFKKATELGALLKSLGVTGRSLGVRRKGSEKQAVVLKNKSQGR